MSIFIRVCCGVLFDNHIILLYIFINSAVVDLGNGQFYHTPFQNKEQLQYLYGKPYVFTSRAEMHVMNPVCTR
jgi:hypothetical protein